MPTVGLIATGQALGRTTGQSVLLSALRANGYTRTKAGSGYLRVNPAQVQLGNAADPDDGVSGLHSLGAWYGYNHSNVTPPGSQLAVVSGYGEAALTWALPSFYSRAPSILNQRIYAKNTGETTINATSLSVDPFDTPDQTQLAGDGTGDAVSLASYEGNVVAIGVKTEFDDSVTVHSAAVGYSAAAGQDALIGAGAGVAVLVLPSNPGPVTVEQLTDPDSCFVGENVTLRVHFNMQGSSTGRLEVSVDGGGFTLVDSAVTAGASSSDQVVASGHTYKYRLRYNAVSPDDWATQSGSFSATCNLI